MKAVYCFNVWMRMCYCERMKALLLALALAAAVPAQVKLDTALTSGPVTIECNFVDLSGWPLIFRLGSATSFHCLIATTSSDTVEFLVSIVTLDKDGTSHAQS